MAATPILDKFRELTANEEEIDPDLWNQLIDEQAGLTGEERTRHIAERKRISTVYDHIFGEDAVYNVKQRDIERRRAGDDPRETLGSAGEQMAEKYIDPWTEIKESDPALLKGAKTALEWTVALGPRAGFAVSDLAQGDWQGDPTTLEGFIQKGGVGGKVFDLLAAIPGTKGGLMALSKSKDALKAGKGFKAALDTGLKRGLPGYMNPAGGKQTSLQQAWRFAKKHPWATLAGVGGLGVASGIGSGSDVDPTKKGQGDAPPPGTTVDENGNPVDGGATILPMAKVPYPAASLNQPTQNLQQQLLDAANLQLASTGDLVPQAGGHATPEMRKGHNQWVRNETMRRFGQAVKDQEREAENASVVEAQRGNMEKWAAENLDHPMARKGVANWTPEEMKTWYTGMNKMASERLHKDAKLQGILDSDYEEREATRQNRMREIEGIMGGNPLENPNLFRDLQDTGRGSWAEHPANQTPGLREEYASLQDPTIKSTAAIGQDYGGDKFRVDEEQFKKISGLQRPGTGYVGTGKEGEEIMTTETAKAYADAGGHKTAYDELSPGLQSAMDLTQDPATGEVTRSSRTSQPQWTPVGYEKSVDAPGGQVLTPGREDYFGDRFSDRLSGGDPGSGRQSALDYLNRSPGTGVTPAPTVETPAPTPTPTPAPEEDDDDGINPLWYGVPIAYGLSELLRRKMPGMNKLLPKILPGAQKTLPGGKPLLQLTSKTRDAARLGGGTSPQLMNKLPHALTQPGLNKSAADLLRRRQDVLVPRAQQGINDAQRVLLKSRNQRKLLEEQLKRQQGLY